MKIVLFGAGGNGKELMPILLENFLYQSNCTLEDFLFVESSPQKDNVLGVKVMSEKAFFEKDYFEEVLFHVSIAEPKTRLDLVNKFLSRGYKSIDIISKLASISKNSNLGIGVSISPFVLISTDVVVGNFSQINYFASISHDVVVGNFVTICPGARINGYINIEDEVFIGAQATIKPGSIQKPRIIGRGAKIGMGAVVLDNVEPFSTVAGNPARKLQ